MSNVNNRLSTDHAADRRILISTKLCALSFFGVSRGRIIGCGNVQSVAVPAVDIAELGITDAHSLFQHCCKHRLKVAGRTADDLKDL